MSTAHTASDRGWSETARDELSSRSVVIVGGGTSGSVLAARLSQDVTLRVTLLEAGPAEEYGDEVLNPSRAAEVWTSQANSTVEIMMAAPRPIVMVQGRILGGTSAVNYMATVRGQPEDYDAWERAGLPGWGWSDVVKYFVAAENDLDFGASPLHGSDGPLTVSRWMPEEHNRYQSAFAEGLREVGVPEVQDVNDPTQLPGIGVFPATLDAQRQRMTTSSAYLTPVVRSRTNIEIRGGTSVSRVNFDGDRAIGVTLATGEELAADEVIVAAGAIGSPALLLRSGVGPRDQLTNRGIAVHADLPVGSTMSDHLGPAMVYEYDGPVANTGGPSQPVLVGASDGKHIDYHVFPAPALKLDSNSFTLLTYVLRSSGLGSVELGDDVYGPPVVTAPRLPLDAESRLRHAFDVIAAWENSSAAKRINCRPAEPHDLSAPNAVADALDRFTMSYGHMVGTCPMGSVLDTECRVRGLSGLRVVDGSAMPRIPAGNTYLGCVMIAERVAELMIAAPIRRTP